MWVSVTAVAQQEYSGVILDQETNDPLIGVSILLEGTSKGTLSDLDGSFTIEASSGDVLVISYVGYQTQKIELGAETELSIALGTDTQVLDEIVVVGYGTIKKSDLTGSVSKVSSEDIVKVPSSNAMNALQGFKF